MWEVIEHLHLGGNQDAENLARLKNAGVTHIVNCAFEVPCYFPDDFKYCPLGLDDPDPEFWERVPKAYAFIDEGRTAGAVLVHCSAGKSRSPAVVVAYLAERGYGVEDALRLVEDKAGAAINMLFQDFLRGYCW